MIGYIDIYISLIHTCLGNGFFLYPFIPSFFSHQASVNNRGLKVWLFFLGKPMVGSPGFLFPEMFMIVELETWGSLKVGICNCMQHCVKLKL